MIRESIIRKYQEIHTVLEEDLRITLSHLEMEERAAVSALDGLMEKSCALIQEIEQDMARLTLALDQIQTEPDTVVIKLTMAKATDSTCYIIQKLLLSKYN